jgi:L-threonylcarbamoyladenylate synthase
MSLRRVSVEEAATLVRSGGVVVYPTETVYGVGADAYNETAVKRVYRVKERPRERPLSVAVGSVDNIEAVARPRDDALEFAREFLPGPVTPLLPRRQRVPEMVTSGDLIGVRVPDDETARSFANSVGPVTSTSANMSGEPPATRPEELGRLADRVDGVIDGGVRDGEPSTVVDTTTWNVVREGAEIERVRDWLSRNVL